MTKDSFFKMRTKLITKNESNLKELSYFARNKTLSQLQS